MKSNRKLHITVIKKSNPISLNLRLEELIPMLSKYTHIVINMRGFKCGELFETIRPLTTRSISATLIVHNGEYEDSDNYDEKLIID
ncbi:MAG: hypothetical protein FGF52_03310 [Candidatus Brockarchaeota archaeon]|nr:hypothetical protein [Candidatus Brockarchaeota archaeon]